MLTQKLKFIMGATQEINIQKTTSNKDKEKEKEKEKQKEKDQAKNEKKKRDQGNERKRIFHKNRTNEKKLKTFASILNKKKNEITLESDDKASKNESCGKKKESQESKQTEKLNKKSITSRSYDNEEDGTSQSDGDIQLYSLNSNNEESSLGDELNPFEIAGMGSDLEQDFELGSGRGDLENMEMGMGMGMEGEGERVVKKTKFQLSTIFQVPSSLGNYKYINKGYRVNFSVPLCFKTALLHAHNETINIWTHFIGLVIFLVLFIITFQLESVKKAERSAKVCIAIYLVGSVLCFFSSTTFHIFNCSSNRIRNIVLRMDLSGVSIMIATTAIPLMDFGFQKSRTFQIIYTIILGAYSIIMILLFWLKKETVTSIPLRLMLLIGMSIIAFGPLVHAFFILPKDLALDFLWRIGILYLLYGIGVLFYILNIPERWSKTGKFDIIGSSHQTWHIFVFISAIYGYTVCLHFIKYYD
ncbi:adiponectin receptor protein [Anaeramoeba flamelloides]|uniref:Adiponectin receptor protein n=1 Tax=Anaeramoeba flamelloides TaxID=1746091 RepID=A0ABQ8YJ71_9EUKA|nr:adiponectin receptor protein [Anaeramoeba flamelloides]